MKAMQRGTGRRSNVRRRPVVGRAAALALAAIAGGLAGGLAGGCSSSNQTPLPDIKPVSTTALSQEERKKAVEELDKKRATHEQDAEEQIEQSR